MTSFLTTTESPACIDKWILFDGEDIEDDKGDLIGQFFPYEEEAKALCAECPSLDWCRNENYKEPYTIIAEKTPLERKTTRRKRS